MTTRILLTGGSGQVGRELRRTLAPLGVVLAPTRDAFDLEDLDGIARAVRAARPGVVVNCGAYTAVDRAESEPERAAAVNGAAPGALARACRERDALLVHLSTDYVFAGDARSPYPETATPSPLGVYGRTKLDGERRIADSGVRHLVVRTSWVYGGHGHNFLRTVLRLAAERDELRVVDDQIGAPTWSRALAEVLGHLVARWIRDPEAFPGGIVHATCAGETSWFGFARAALERAGRLPARMVPIPTSEYPTPAPRPAYSVLANDVLERTYGLRMPEWTEALAMCLEDLGPPPAPAA